MTRPSGSRSPLRSCGAHDGAALALRELVVRDRKPAISSGTSRGPPATLPTGVSGSGRSSNASVAWAAERVGRSCSAAVPRRLARTESQVMPPSVTIGDPLGVSGAGRDETTGGDDGSRKRGPITMAAARMRATRAITAGRRRSPGFEPDLPRCCCRRATVRGARTSIRCRPAPRRRRPSDRSDDSRTAGCSSHAASSARSGASDAAAPAVVSQNAPGSKQGVNIVHG